MPPANRRDQLLSGLFIAKSLCNIFLRLANIQYRGGNINYIDVLDAQRRYLDAQIGLSNAVRDEHLALVQLYKALGGGWTMPDGGRK